MALTRLSDVIVPTVFAGYVQEASINSNRLISSGLIALNPAYSGYLAGPAVAFNLPYWKNIDNDATMANTPTDDLATVANPEKVTASKQVAVRCMRNRVYQFADLAGILAGSDPLAAVATQIAGRQNSDRQAALLSTLAGTINETVAPNLVHTIASEAIAGQTAATAFNASNLIDAVTNAWGDNAGFGGLVVHSRTYAKMQKDNLITFQPTNTQDIGFGTYLGYTLIVDDKAPTRAGTTDGVVYTSYIIRPGGVAMGVAAEDIPIEFERIALAGNGQGVETMVARDRFGFHVSGTAWAGSIAQIPTDVSLASPAAWTKVFHDKAIGVAAIVHN